MKSLTLQHQKCQGNLSVSLGHNIKAQLGETSAKIGNSIQSVLFSNVVRVMKKEEGRNPSQSVLFNNVVKITKEEEARGKMQHSSEQSQSKVTMSEFEQLLDMVLEDC